MVQSLARYRRYRIARNVGTLGQAVGMILLAFAHVWPDEFVRSMDPTYVSNVHPQSIVSFIETLTVIPVWSIALGVASAVILIGMAARRNIWVAAGHLLAACVWAALMIASISTALLNPGTFITWAIASGMLVSVNFVGMWSWAEPRPLYEETSVGESRGAG